MMSLRLTGRCLSQTLSPRWNYSAYNSYRHKFKLNAPLSNNYAALKPSSGELSAQKVATNESPKSSSSNLDANASVQAFDELLSALYLREKQLNQTRSALDQDLAKENREKINLLLRQRLEAQQLKHGTNLFKLDLKNLVLKEDYNDENELRYLIKQIEKEKQALQQKQAETSAGQATAKEVPDHEMAHDFGAIHVDPAATHFEPAEMTQLGENLIDNVHLDDDDATAVKISKSLDAQMNLLKAELDKKRSASELTKQVPHGLSVHSPIEDMIFEKQVKLFNQSMLAYVDVCAQSSNLIQEAYLLLKKLTKMENEAKLREQESKVKFEDDEISLTVTPQPAESAQKTKKKQPSAHYRFIDDVEVYNRLMFAYARKAKLSSINYLFQQMCQEKHVKLTPNLNSYAAALQCIGRIMNNESTSPSTTEKRERTLKSNLRLNVERILWDLKKLNYSVDDLATSTNFSSEQQVDIQQAIRAVMPDFEFKNNLDFSLDNPLTKALKTSARANKAEPAVYPADMLAKEKMMENFREQLKNEKSVLMEVPSIERCSPQAAKEAERKQKIKTKIFRDFKENIHKNFTKQLSLLKQSSTFRESFMYPFLTVMDKSVYVELLLQEAQEISQKSQFFSENLNVISYNMGANLEKKYQKYLMEKNGEIEKIEKAYEMFADYHINKLKDPFDSPMNHREEWQRIINEQNLKINSENHAWPSALRYQLGKYLLQEVLMKSCKIDMSLINNREYQGDKYEYAFHTVFRIVGYYKYPQLKAHPVLSRLYESSLIFDANLMPMVTVPLPWLSPQQGGYFINRTPLLRSSSDEQNEMINRKHVSNIYPVLDSLNLLSTCPWKINTRILDHLIEIFNNGGNKELEVPLPISEGPPVPRPPKTKLNKDEYKAYLRLKDKTDKIRAEMYSLWCSELYRLSIANMCRDKVVYFPHNLDFRGRSYPMPPHFNHLGSDISRSIISLAVGKKLGPKGLDTLKLHLMNLTGTMKKSTLEERLAYANQIIDEIVDSAEKPFSGRLWWQKSEEKWQTLACCMEIADAIKSGNPAEFVSHFPIHQDGSCNGLQHYAAMGRDQDGAVSVNLSPSERPQDVYSTVLDLVEAHRLKDEPTSEIARLLAGYIKRKVIKQTVMTTVYNVTMYGAKLQILRQLEDTKGFPLDRASEASTYLAKKTFASIRELFTSAKEIQDWFGKCAYLISKIRDNTVKWHTPLMLPISQPYYQKVASRKNGTHSIPTDKPNSMKQRSAFPPNYVHSLDSCHMMLTSLYCEKAGITFISVHDCFWTHACDVDLMNKICREQFIALHSLPLLETLSKSFLEAHKFTQEEIDSHENEDAKSAMIQFNNILANVPKKGNFDLNKVMQSTYFFS